MRTNAWILVVTMAVGCASKNADTRSAQTSTQTPKAAIEPKDWDSLCPATGASAPQSIHVNEDVMFEPSGAAVWEGRVAILGDKQTHLWWWKPGADVVEKDAEWAFKDLA